MKLTALRLYNVRRFAERGIAIEGIGEGVNVLCAPNEQGKSTCFDALHALFFQPHTGTPKAVQALRTYSGGSPLVEVDVEVEGRPLRLTKQFYAGRRAVVTDLSSGRVLAQADEAERRIAALVQDETRGPAGLLWVRQGNTGLQRRLKSEEEDEKQARETALTSVQGEVEAVTGGRRMREALQACEAELAPYVTATGRPKVGGPLALAMERRDSLAAAEARLAADVQDLRAALDERRRCMVRLAELTRPEEVAARHKRAAETEAALKAGRDHADALTLAEQRAALARQMLHAEKVALENFRAASQRAVELQVRRGNALQRSLEMEARGKAAAAAIGAAESEVEASEAAEREARELLARHERAQRAREAALRLERAREVLADALAARRELEECEAEQRALAAPQKILRELAALERSLAESRAAQAARAPTLRIDYQAAPAGRISLAGQPLQDGEERPLDTVTRLEVEEIGLLTIRQRHRDDEAEALAKAESRQALLLAQLGVPSLAAAEERAKAAEAKANQANLAKQRLDIQAPKGIEALRETIATLEREVVNEGELPGDLPMARQALEAAQQRVETARNALRALRPGEQQAREARTEAAANLAAIERDLAEAERALGPPEGRADRDSALAVSLARASAAHDEAAAEVARLGASAPDLAGLEAATTRAVSVLKATEEEAARLRERAAMLGGIIDTRADGAVEEAWEEAKAARAAAEAEVARIEQEVALLTRLRTALRESQSKARDLFFRPVMTELRPLLGLLFEDAAVAFDEETLLPRSVTRGGLEEEIDVLSGGMREQVAVLTRLAFARLLAQGGRPTPVILDDALVYSDDDRIERMFDALHRNARDQQIIVFSCRQRAFARLGGNSLGMTDWSPERR